LSIFEHLDTDEQQNLLHSLTDESAIEFVNELQPDDRVRLLDELPATMARKLINSLTPEERRSTNILLGYENETAGRIMTPEYISLRGDMSVDDALGKVRKEAKGKETIYNLYITNNSRRLEGVISLKELLMADGEVKVEEIMTKKAISVFTDTDQERVARTLQDMDLLAIPVVDKEERLVGIVTIDDAIDILEEEATEDILNQAGLVAGKEANRSETLIQGSLFSIWKVRLPFLFIAIFGGMVAALVMEGFEEVLESVVAVAFFIPLVMDTGGSVGTQSSTVFARGVVLGHIRLENFAKHFVKEIGVGFSLGAMSGFISGIIVTIIDNVFWDGGTPMLGVAVGLAMVITMTFASLLGFLVPFVLVKLNVDQAAGATPIITSLKDISGLFIYFASVTLILGHLL
jgi:magnesium transporter